MVLGKLDSQIQNTENGPLSFFFFFKLLPTLCGMWNLNSPTRDQTHIPCNGSIESMDHQAGHWTTIIHHTQKSPKVDKRLEHKKDLKL